MSTKIGGVGRANCLHMGSIHRKLGGGDGQRFKKSGGVQKGWKMQWVGEGVEDAMW